MQTRLIELIDKTTSSSRRFKELEEKTGIAATSWQKVHIGRQRATQQMIEAICCVYPTCALWLTTGKIDEANDQLDIDGYIAKATYRITEVLTKSPADWSSGEALVVRIELAKALKVLNEIDLANYVGRYESLLSDYARSRLANQHETQNISAEDDAAQTVQVWRDVSGPRTNVSHHINLREPMSPAGFEWGYHGAGPRELAANVLHHFGLQADEAKLLATEFSIDVISNLNKEKDWINKEEFSLWMKRKGLAILRGTKQ